MGASESTLSSSHRPEVDITTVSERSEIVDPVMKQLKSLKIATPILTSALSESSLTDILVRKASSSSNLSTVNPNVLLELFSMYRDWQEQKAQTISKRQEEIENKIEVADALAVKLLQPYNYSVSAMRTTSHHLSEVHALQVELGELKGRLTEVISDCDALCQRITRGTGITSIIYQAIYSIISGPRYHSYVEFYPSRYGGTAIIAGRFRLFFCLTLYILLGEKKK